MMQELFGDPIELLIVIAVVAVFFVALTYFGTGRLKIKGF